ncbi:thioredoxin-disulfide reductase [[Clostridium] fimetarium]|uniref:Thioredoxin reductase n=1 Tax=[Clostridium] fimetarium TaxID=99656 RepID=A0A1I0RMI6_9FIRM|nr:thioredoxin-disulfide reductase [[Clostridium] fimetarium]SEW42420.1 thioredoxin reductase (NADPH) [[Clostridium] fimetarium]
MYDIIIIGAGTAGLSAAIYGVRAGKSVLILEADSYGGQIINTPEIENYPAIKHISGYDFATNLYEQAIELGAEIRIEKVLEIKSEDHGKKVITDSNQYEAKSIILATGAKSRTLGLEREKELVGRGISYCATCDGGFFKGKEVAINGGGSTALEEALYLSSFCAKVYLIHRRDSFRGEDRLLHSLQEKQNVEFVLNSVIKELIADNKIKGIIVKNIETGTELTIPISGLFIAIGQTPENGIFANLINLDKSGYISATEDCKTNIKGIFVAGDTRTKRIRQLTTAAADGAVAALAASEYIG